MEWILRTIARFFLANSQYLSAHFFAWPSMPKDQATVSACDFSKPRKVRDQTTSVFVVLQREKCVIKQSAKQDMRMWRWLFQISTKKMQLKVLEPTREKMFAHSIAHKPLPVSETPYRKIRWKPSTWRGVRQVCDPVHADENEDDVDQEHKFHAFLESGLWRLWWLCKIGLLHSRSSFGRKSLIALSASELSSVSWVHSGLEHSKQTSSSFRAVAARSTWQCTSCLHVLYGPNVYMCLRATQ